MKEETSEWRLAGTIKAPDSQMSHTSLLFYLFKLTLDGRTRCPYPLIKDKVIINHNTEYILMMKISSLQFLSINKNFGQHIEKPLSFLISESYKARICSVDK